MRKSAITLCIGVVLCLTLLAASAIAAGRVPDGTYGESVAVTTGPGDYSNGGVDLYVSGRGRKIRGGSYSGVACYTGANPPQGVPANDELSIHLPRSLPISSDGSFSFSGPVTLTPQDTQQEGLTITTTFRIKGRFARGKKGSYTATGTDSSPICQPTTLKKFTVKHVGVN